jgi:hypothetical protein
VLAAVRPLRRGALVALSGFLIVLVWFFLIPPSNDRDWQKDVLKDAVWSWKILLNGRLDELLYAIGAVRENLPLAELRARGHVNDRARAAERDPDFSRRIREGMPARFSAR